MSDGVMSSVRDLLEVRTAGYRPPLQYKPSFTRSGLPPFTLTTVEMMRRDPQVKLGMATKLAPFHVVKLTLKGNPKTCQYVAELIRRFWSKALPKITRAFWYTMSGGETICRSQAGATGQFEWWNYNDVYPSDIAILHRNGQPKGISIKQTQDAASMGTFSYSFSSAAQPTNGQEQARIPLLFPKGFLYLHKREFNSLTGSSDFEAAYPSWVEKTDYQGALHSRKLWFYKNAFSGGMLFHPPGNYTTETGEKIPYRDLARQAMESALNGAVWCIEQVFDPNTKQPYWQYVEPKLNGDGKGLLEYVSHLDNEIMRGLEIPDDVVQQVSGTGSYAGRSIPMMSFFTNQTPVLTNLFNVCDEQVFRPITKHALGTDDYEASIEVDIDRLIGAPPEPPGIGQDNQNPNDPNGEGGLAQQQQADQPKQFSDDPATNRTMHAVQRAWNSVDGGGEWDANLGMRIVYNEPRIFQMGQVREPAGRKTRNRSGKESKGGQFTDNAGGSNKNDYSPEALQKAFPHLYEKEQALAKKKSGPRKGREHQGVKVKVRSENLKSSHTGKVPFIHLTEQTKAAIAKTSMVRVDAVGQRWAEANEVRLAKQLGGTSYDDGEPVDIVVKGKSGKLLFGIELKTLIYNGNNKITMKTSAMMRKAEWERKNKVPVHTVVLDDQKSYKSGKLDESQRRIFYKRGYGSFRIEGMHEVTGGIKELKQLLAFHNNQLPPKAKAKA